MVVVDFIPVEHTCPHADIIHVTVEIIAFHGVAAYHETCLLCVPVDVCGGNRDAIHSLFAYHADDIVVVAVGGKREVAVLFDRNFKSCLCRFFSTWQFYLYGKCRVVALNLGEIERHLVLHAQYTVVGIQR